MSTGRDLEESNTRASRLFRYNKADIGTLPKTLTPSSSSAASLHGQDGAEDVNKVAHQTLLGDPFLSLSNGSDNLSRSFNTANYSAKNRESAKSALLSPLQPSNVANKTGGSSSTPEHTEKRENEITKREDDVEGEDSESEAEEEEIHLDIKPSYLDRLSNLVP